MKSFIKLDNDIEEKIILLFNSFQTTKEIAQKLGVHSSTVLNVWKRNGFIFNERLLNKVCIKCKELKPITSEYYQKCVNNKNGFKGTCRNCLSAASLTFISKREKYKEYEAKIVYEFGSLKSVSELSREYKLPRTNIYDVWYRNGFVVENRPKIKLTDKQCSRCKQVFPLNTEHFFISWRKKSNNFGFRSRCKMCQLEYSRNYRDRKNKLPSLLTLEEWFSTLKSFNYKCSNCRSDKKLTLDHWYSISNYKTGTVKWNIIPLCKSCNSSKRNKHPHRWMKDITKIIKIQSYLNKQMDFYYV